MVNHVDWSHRDVHMFARHRITTSQADEALSDPERVVIEPDYASRSGRSTRIIGYAASLSDLLTIIVVRDEGVDYGASGWRSNIKDRAIYHSKEESWASSQT